MIRVVLEKENNLYNKVTILGHAMYDDYGKDIVCSACSSIVTTSVNGILSLEEDGLHYLVNEDGLFIDEISSSKTVQILIQNMINLLKELESNYPDNISVK